MAKTFSELVQEVVGTVRVTLAAPGLRPGHVSSSLVGRHVRAALRKDGEVSPPKSLVAPVVEAVLDTFAAERAGHGGAP